MNTKAAVTTPKGLGAIANIQLAGADAAKIIEKIAKPAPNKFTVGKIHVCEIIDGDKTIDHVVIGHEAKKTFAISCHGNPFITEAIIKLLQKHGAQIVSTQEFLASSSATENVIQTEARLEQLKAPSVQAVKLIAAQSHHGLAKTVAGWHKNKELSLGALIDQCNQILESSQKAGPMIHGCNAVIAGPPNSGKSTLINTLAGKQKAIVTDIAGTTRDWVSIDCRIGPVLVKFFDTAGLDENLATNNAVDKASQQTTRTMIDNADIIVYLSDAQNPLSTSPPNWIGNKTVILAQNKCDLLSDEQLNSLPKNHLRISAEKGTGIDKLSDAIINSAGVMNLDPQTPICFTQRQFDLLSIISIAEDFSIAKTAITQLLNGPVSV